MNQKRLFLKNADFRWAFDVTIAGRFYFLEYSYILKELTEMK